MRRLFTAGEISTWLEHCYRYVADVFGAEYCISPERLRRYRAAAAHFYQPYGDFTTSPPTVLALANCVLISHQSLAEMKAGQRKETELEPWQPSDGPAVFWVASVVSDVPGGALMALNGVMDQVDASPQRHAIDTIAVFCTGPQGYLMSTHFGLAESGFHSEEGWPFMEKQVTPGQATALGAQRILQDIWSVARIKDAIRHERQTHGREWRQRRLAE